MAKFVPAVGDIAGKIGNLVFSRNRYGPTIRRRAVPVNTRTMRQRTTRAFLSAASSYWRTLTTNQHLAWNAFAANFPLHQGKGTKTAVTVTGQAFSVAINAMRYLTGLAAIGDPPDTWGTTQPNAVTAAVVGATSVIVASIAGVTLDASFGVLVKATGPLSKGVAFIGKSKYKSLGVFPPTVSLPLDVTANYAYIFGAVPPTGTVIGLSVQVVRLFTGAAGVGAATACPGQPVFIRMVAS